MRRELLGAGCRVTRESACVGAGELEGVEEVAGVGGVDLMHGDGGEERRDGELDGFGVFEWDDLEGAAARGAGGELERVEAVVLVVLDALGRPFGELHLSSDGGAMDAAQLAMEVAERMAAQRRRLAAAAIGFDVGAERIGAGFCCGRHSC